MEVTKMVTKTSIAEPNLQTLDAILREHLIAEVKRHLVQLIDKEMEELARNAVVRFMSIEIAKHPDVFSMSDTYLFSFVQNITETIVKPVVIKELNNEKNS